MTDSEQSGFYRSIVQEYGDGIVAIVDHVQQQLRAPIDQSVSHVDIELGGQVVMRLSSHEKGAWRDPFIMQSPGKTPFVIEAYSVRPVQGMEKHLLLVETKVEYRSGLDVSDLQVALDTPLHALDPADEKIVKDILKAVVEADGDGMLRRLDRKDLPILYIDEHMLIRNHVTHLLRQSDLPIIVVATQDELKSELRGRGMSERNILEKLTGMVHPMRSDVEPLGLAEVVHAMPAFEVNNPGKSSRRPALPKNRKRDRWN
jgi:hypothetical protein